MIQYLEYSELAGYGCRFDFDKYVSEGGGNIAFSFFITFFLDIKAHVVMWRIWMALRFFSQHSRFRSHQSQMLMS